MLKQIGALGSFDSIVYTRTCDVIVMPMCKCLYISSHAALYDSHPWLFHTPAVAPHCILEFGFRFGFISDCRSDQYGCPLYYKVEPVWWHQPVFPGISALLSSSPVIGLTCRRTATNIAHILQDGNQYLLTCSRTWEGAEWHSQSHIC